MDEKKYIERGLILGTMATYFGKADDREEQATIDIWNGIKKIPAADVVEVVRCKDCKHSVKYNCKNDACYSFTICRRRDGYAEDVEEDDFCSYGERKEQNNV